MCDSITRLLKITMPSFLIFSLVLFILISCGSPRQDLFIPEFKLSPAELKADLNQLRNIIEDNHPTINANQGYQTFEEYFDSLYSTITDSLTIVDFYLLARPLVEKVNCGHTHLWLPEGCWSQIINHYRHFPFKLLFDDGRAFVRYNYSDNSIPAPGTEIITVNNTPMAKIIDNLLKLISSEGKNETSKYYHMNNITFGLFPGYKEFPDIYNIEFIPPGDTVIRRMEISAGSYEQIKQRRELLNENERSGSYSYMLIDSLETAVIDINFFPYENKGDQRKFLKEAFSEITRSGINNLIIDVRYNEGGDPFMASLLVSYIIDSEYTYFVDYVTGYSDLKRPMKPQEPNFDGNIYVLINGGSFSTTGHFLSLMKYYELGTFIGEESGGTYKCNGCVKEFELTRTSFILECGRCIFRTKVYGLDKNRGILPDIEVKPSIADIIEDNDIVMKTALDIILQTEVEYK
ncbi:MAG: hypothetical protein GY839_07820 [candidate division Zixibacteria bacterium]|nr:hypothetical protein [candidate division Zixibacteria bacterium]